MFLVIYVHFLQKILKRFKNEDNTSIRNTRLAKLVYLKTILEDLIIHGTADTVKCRVPCHSAW